MYIHTYMQTSCIHTYTYLFIHTSTQSCLSMHVYTYIEHAYIHTFSWFMWTANTSCNTMKTWPPRLSSYACDVLSAFNIHAHATVSWCMYVCMHVCICMKMRLTRPSSHTSCIQRDRQVQPHTVAANQTNEHTHTHTHTHIHTHRGTKNPTDRQVCRQTD